MAEAVEAAEDAEYGAGFRGDELPKELQRASDRIKRIAQLKAELEAEAREQAEAQRVAKTEAAQVEAALREMRNVEAAHEAAGGRGDDDEPPLPPSPEAPAEHQGPTGKSGT